MHYTTQPTGETATLSKGKSTGTSKSNEIECDRQTPCPQFLVPIGALPQDPYSTLGQSGIYNFKTTGPSSSVTDSVNSPIEAISEEAAEESIL